MWVSVAPMFSLLLLGVLPGALAHRPHTVILATAASPTFSTDKTVVAVVDPHDVSQIIRSVDGGMHWSFLGGDPQDDTLVATEWVTGVLYVLGKDCTLWLSTDLAASWTSQQLPGSALCRDLEVEGPKAFVATSKGVYVGDLTNISGMVARQGSVDFVEVKSSRANVAHVVAVSADGKVWLSTDTGATLNQVTPLPGGVKAYSAAEIDGRIVVGTDDYAWYSADEGSTWQACGDLPTVATESHYDEVVIVRALPDGTLLAATGRESLFVSSNACASWQFLDSGDLVPFGGVGNAVNEEEAYTDLLYTGGTYFASGFDGVFLTPDSGVTWTRPKLIPADYARGVAFAPDFPADPRIFIGGYGGAVWWTADGGVTWDGSAVGVEGVYAYDVQPDSDFSTSGRVYYSGSNVPYVSLDEGRTWSIFELPMDRVRVFRPYGPRVYALGEDEVSGAVEGQVAFSDDGGLTWSEFPSLYALMQKSAPRDFQEVTVRGADWFYAVVDSAAGIIGSKDGGVSWSWLHQGAKETAAGGEVWPPSAPVRWVFASATDGVIWSEDDGASWTPASVPPSGKPRHMAMADDGTLFIVTRTGQMWRSEDGGDTWAQAGNVIAPAAYDVVTSPGFATSQKVLVGTQTGIFYSEDRGASWVRLPRYERFEDRSEHLDCYKPATLKADGPAPPPHISNATFDPCDVYEDPNDGFGGGYLMQAGDWLAFSFEGHAFSVIGADAGEGTFEVEVNGARWGTLTADGKKLKVEGLPQGWQDVTLTVTGTTAGIKVDLVEAFGEGVPMDLPGGWTTGATDSGLTTTSTSTTTGTATTTATTTGTTGTTPDSGLDTGGPTHWGSCGCGTPGLPGAAWGVAVAGAALVRRRRSRS